MLEFCGLSAQRADALREAQREILQMIARNAPRPQVLRRLCELVEGMGPPDARCSVLLVGGEPMRLRTGAAPSLPPAYCKAIDGILAGPAQGSCGTAAWRREPVIVEDIATDPLWEHYRDLALAHGLRACCSIPVFGAGSRVLATFAIYYAAPRRPAQHELALLQTAVALASVVIEQARTEEQLKESWTKLELAQNIARLGYWEREIASDRMHFFGETNAILGLPASISVDRTVFEAQVLEEDRHVLAWSEKEAAGGRVPGPMAFRIRRADGSVRHLFAQHRLLEDASGAPLKMVGTLQDVTEQRQTEHTLHHYLSQLAFLAKAARKVNSSLSVEELLQAIADNARSLVDARVAVAVILADEDGTRALERRSVSGRRAGGSAPDETWLEVPIVSGDGRLLGSIRVTDKEEGEFTANDERVLTQLADLAAVGLENARLYAELEARVRRRTQELEQSNRELEAFSYSVSHDLRGPLRAIAGFASLLREQHCESLDAQGRHYLERILAGTQRMSALIDDLLELGRVTRVEIRRADVDLTEIARTVVARLCEQAPQRAVEVTIEDGCRVHGDPRLMEIVLENLLDNAWKFSAGRAPARIGFGARSFAGGHAFYVRDNGVGFDLRYASNLFGVFQRLHAAEEFPGTGVGLATVQRIIQRHGGRIWAEAQVERGATFYFTVAEG